MSPGGAGVARSPRLRRSVHRVTGAGSIDSDGRQRRGDDQSLPQTVVALSAQSTVVRAIITMIRS